MEGLSLAMGAVFQLRRRHNPPFVGYVDLIEPRLLRRADARDRQDGELQ